MQFTLNTIFVAMNMVKNMHNTEHIKNLYHIYIHCPSDLQHQSGNQPLIQ